jgi:hypothetical protein
MRIIHKRDGMVLSYKQDEKSKVYDLIKSREARLRNIDDEILSARKKVQSLVDMRNGGLEKEIQALYDWAKMFEAEAANNEKARRGKQ